MINRVFDLMSERKITPYQIERATKIPHNYFSIWKKGGCQPSVKFLSILADYFDVSVDYLLGKTTRRKPYRS